jgi:RNA polymerase sigma factor (TIGR02999 family)
MPLVYYRLRTLAHRALAGERPGHTLSTTALANEAYLKLRDLDRIEWQNRSHFFAVAARAMRRILVDHAVSRKALKRGGGAPHVTIDTGVAANDGTFDELLALDEALTRLEDISPRAVRVVECRVLMGMTIDETATALDLSIASIKRQWNTARAWLTRELSGVATR